MFLRNKRVFSIALILMLFIGAFTACGKADDKTEVDENTVAMVNGEKIDYESFQKNFSVVERKYNEWYTENIWSQEIKGKTVLEIVKGQVLDKLITEELLRQEADKKGIKADEATVKEMYDGFKEGLEKDEELKKFYEENNLDEKFVKNQIGMQLIIEGYEKALFEEIGLNDEKLKEMTKDYIVKVRARHILVEDEESAKEIITKIEAGEDFTALAKQHSKDTSVEQNEGDLGYFIRGDMVPEFEKAAFTLNVGEISEPVKSEFGYHIIKVEDKKTIEDLKEELSEEELAVEKNKVEIQIKEDEFIKRIEELKSQANVERFEENLK